MKLSHFFSTGLCMTIIAMWMTFLSIGHFPYFDVLSVTLVTIVGVMMIGMLVTLADRRGRALVYMFVMGTSTLFVLRFLSLMIDPSKLVNNLVPPSVGDVNLTLFYLLMGTMAMWIAFWVGLKERMQETEDDEADQLVQNLSPSVTALLTVFFTALFSYMFYKMGYGRYDLYTKEFGTAFKAIVSLVDLNMVTMVCIAVAMASWRISKFTQRLLIVIAVLSLILWRLGVGSKAAVVDFVLIWCICVFARRREPRVNLVMMVVLGMPLFILAVAAFSAGMAIRQLTVGVSAGAAFSLTLSDIIWVLKAYGFNFWEMASSLFARLEGFDSLVPIVAQKGVDLREHVNLINTMESFLNIALPGKPFITALNEGTAYNVVYLGHDAHWYYEESLSTTSMWTHLGMFHGHFGFGGGLVMLTLATYFYCRAYEWLCQISSAYSLILKAWFIYNFQWLLIGFGLDYIMQKAPTTLGSGLFIIFLIRVLTRAWRTRNEDESAGGVLHTY